MAEKKAATRFKSPGGGPWMNNSGYDDRPLSAHILSLIDKPDGEDGCWIWRGRVESHGYGVVHSGPRHLKIHRLFYFRLVGSTDLVIDHLCRNKLCCNPAHLEAVPHAVNVARGESGKYIRDRTHCVNGHEYTPRNTRLWNGHRECRTCRRISKAAHRNRSQTTIRLELTEAKP